VEGGLFCELMESGDELMESESWKKSITAFGNFATHPRSFENARLELLSNLATRHSLRTGFPQRLERLSAPPLSVRELLPAALRLWRPPLIQIKTPRQGNASSRTLSYGGSRRLG